MARIADSLYAIIPYVVIREYERVHLPVATILFCLIHLRMHLRHSGIIHKDTVIHNSKIRHGSRPG